MTEQPVRLFMVLPLVASSCASATPPPMGQPAAPLSEPAKSNAMESFLGPGDEANLFELDTLGSDPATPAKVNLKHHLGPRATEPKSAVVLSFGASYCEPCLQELPSLQKLHERYRSREVLVVLVVVDQTDEGRQIMRRRILDAGLGLPVVVDRFEYQSRRYGASELPLLVLIDRHGKVAWRQSGYSERSLESLASRLESILETYSVQR